MSKKVITCIGTRPNIIKITRLNDCFKKYNNMKNYLLHTGQHHDYRMSEVFFDQLNISKPDFLLKTIQGSQIEVVADIMTKFEKVVIEEKPDLVMVPGDVNSSMACAIVAARYNIPVAHIESGLRSFDNSMPEEQNRILIDAISSLFFVTEQSGVDNLLKSGVDKNKIHFVGNTMIDTLEKYKNNINECYLPKELEEGKYILATFHRPINVDNCENLQKLVSILYEASKSSKIIFPIHPRTKKKLDAFGLLSLVEENRNIIFSEPLGYFDFIKLIKNSKAVITDSGGIQEETTYLGIPCITLRNSTERPVTVSEGTNTMLDLDVNLVLKVINDIDLGIYKKGNVPHYWDGNATERIVKIISDFLYD